MQSRMQTSNEVKDVIKDWIKKGAEDVHVSMIGKVESYDPSTNRAQSPRWEVSQHLIGRRFPTQPSTMCLCSFLVAMVGKVDAHSLSKVATPASLSLQTIKSKIFYQVQKVMT